MNRAAFLRNVFRVSLFVEIAGFVLLFALGFGGFAVALFIFPVLIGLVGAAIGALPKPHSRGAIVAFAINALCVAYYFVGPSIDSALREHRDQAFEQDQQAEQELERTRARQRDEFARLFQRGQVQEAKDYLEDHEGLPLADEAWLARLFCGLGDRVPDRALLVQLRDYARLRDGDLVGAASRCSRELTERVLDLGFDACAMTASGSKAQMQATTVPALALLFERGCSLEARSFSGRTALMYHRSPEITRFLLQRGARPNAVDTSGRSALFFCGPADALGACLELILQAGADPSLREDVDRDTPLISQAQHCKNQRAADVLVAHGADPEARDISGKSAVMYVVDDRDRLIASLRWPGVHIDGLHGADLLQEAINRGAWEQAELLLDAGANPNMAASNGRTAAARLEDIGFNTYRSDDPRYAAHLRFAARLGRLPPGQ